MSESTQSGAGLAVTASGPGRIPYPIHVDGQVAWVHDEGHSAGYFHTYDALRAAGPEDLPRSVHVFLPREYPSSGRGYPVLYMNDGNTAFWPGGLAGKTWGVAERVSKLCSEGALPPLIVVAVHPVQRDREYTHALWSPGRECCGLPGYAAWLAHSLKPFIEAHYRTMPGKPNAALAGSSHGGLAAFYTSMVHAPAFGAAIAMSSSFWTGIDDTGPGGPLATSGLIEVARGTLEDRARRPRLWIDWGMIHHGGAHNEIIEARACARGREMRGLLTGTYGYAEPWELSTYEDEHGAHDEDSWGRRLERALLWWLG